MYKHYCCRPRVGLKTRKGIPIERDPFFAFAVMLLLLP